MRAMKDLAGAAGQLNDLATCGTGAARTVPTLDLSPTASVAAPPLPLLKWSGRNTSPARPRKEKL